MNTAADNTMNTDPNTHSSRMMMLIKSIPTRFHSKLILGIRCMQGESRETQATSGQ